MDDVDAELFAPRIGQSAWTWGATTTVNLALARFFTGTNSQVSTIAFSNVPSTFPNGAVVPVVECWLILTNGGAFAITWPASVTWLSGTAPSLQAAGVDIVKLVTRDGGTTWYGALIDVRGRARVGTSTLQARMAQVLYQNQSVQTASASEVSIVSYSLPANALAVNAQALRITAHGNYSAGSGTGAALIKFGATIIATEAIANGSSFRFEVLLTRVGASTQTAASMEINNAVLSAAYTAPAETLSGAVTVDFRGNVGTGGALSFLSTQIEYLGA